MSENEVLAELANVVAHMADAMQQYLSGSMDKTSAVGNLRTLNSRASKVFWAVSKK